MKNHIHIFIGLCLIFSLQNLHAQYKYFSDNRKPEHSNIGIQVGSGIVYGDMKNFEPSYQGSLYYQYHFAPILDGRISIGYGKYKGYSTTPSTSIVVNPALNGTLNTGVDYTNTGKYYANYQTVILDLQVLGKLNFIPIFNRNYKGKFQIYGLGGISMTRYITAMNLTGKDNALYPYQNITTTNPSEVKNTLNAMWDNSYESFAEYDPNKPNRIGLAGGGGIRIRLGDRFAVGSEALVKYYQDDLLDGQKWKTNTEETDNNDLIWNVGLIFELFL